MPDPALDALLFNLENASVAHVRGAANLQEVLAARAAIVTHVARLSEQRDQLREALVDLVRTVPVIDYGNEVRDAVALLAATDPAKEG